MINKINHRNAAIDPGTGKRVSVVVGQLFENEQSDSQIEFLRTYPLKHIEHTELESQTSHP